MNTVILCKKCQCPYEHTDTYFYRTQGYLLKTCKKCMNARHVELYSADRPVEPDQAIIVFPKATRHCSVCGYWMADVPELWGVYDPRICRICETPMEVYS